MIIFMIITVILNSVLHVKKLGSFPALRCFHSPLRYRRAMRKKTQSGQGNFSLLSF